MSCKVTICCVAYQHEKYIRKTLDGFLNQKFHHFRLKDVPSPFLGITAIYCFVYFINNYILCFLPHFNVLVLNSF